ncbi:hypothetical protein NMY22_g3804 [Coprinellus aureogranulatus]|nr:hypothetical protein NMY22_g3804 [Coprinellus aureogranulatus]
MPAGAGDALPPTPPHPPQPLSYSSSSAPRIDSTRIDQQHHRDEQQQRYSAQSTFSSSSGSTDPVSIKTTVGQPLLFLNSIPNTSYGWSGTIQNITLPTPSQALPSFLPTSYVPILDRLCLDLPPPSRAGGPSGRGGQKKAFYSEEAGQYNEGERHFRRPSRDKNE